MALLNELMSLGHALERGKGCGARKGERWQEPSCGLCLFPTLSRRLSRCQVQTPSNMSVDLDWNQLAPLSANLVNTLNRLLSATQRPSFIGPITINSFDFGHVPPEVDLVDVQNIYRDFLEDDDADKSAEMKERTSTSPPVKEEEEDYEWISRRGIGKAYTADSLNYHYLPPHIRYGAGPASGSVKLEEGAPARRIIDEGFSPGEYGPRGGASTSNPNGISASFEAPESVSVTDRREKKSLYGGEGEDGSKGSRSPSPPRESPLPVPEEPLPPPAQSTGEDIQLHFKVHHESDLRITLTTSLLINYPSPLFMSLPMTLTVVGMVFNGEVVVAYEASKRRIHLCILDDQDPYSLKSSSRPTPPSAEGATSPLSPSNSHGYISSSATREPAGQRLLPSIFIESEIGQADKHVLRNVSRLERFIQDMIRKTLEEELVWPNFHTILLGD
jgi:distribution and morphology protein 12